jgi:hypothetical protein
MRLIELTATSIHQVAVQLYNLGTSLHNDDGIASWEPQKDHLIFWILNPDGPPPTLFQHRQYRCYDQYPDRIADGVGYWAESRIFGGVVLFDRREPGSADDVDVSNASFNGLGGTGRTIKERRYFANWFNSPKACTCIQSVKT